MMSPVRQDAWRDPRSWGLIGCAFVCTSRAVAYVPGTRERLPLGLRQFAEICPVWVYGIMWAAAALGAVLIALRQWPPKWWHALLVAPPMVWGGFYFTSSLTDDIPSGLPSALLFWALAEIFACLLLIQPRWR